MPARTRLARSRKRCLRLVAAITATAVVTVPPLATAQDLERVEQRRQALEREIDATLTAVDHLHDRIVAARDELASLEERQAQLERQAAAANLALASRAREAFMRGQPTALTSLLSSEGPANALERARLLAALSRRDVVALESATALRTQIDQTEVLLAARSVDLARLEAEMEERAGALQERFRTVDVVYRELKTRRDRQTRLSRGAQQGVYACIFQGAYRFRDTWGAPRSGGRRHKGTDVFSYYGAPVYAFTSGRVQRTSRSGLGGIGLYLWGDDGIQYYYAHLKGYAPGIHGGKRVEAGQLIAYNGDSGNAARSAPHVHFEVHPGGGGAVNPYHWLAPVC